MKWLKIINLNVSVVNVEKVQVPMADLGEGPGGQAPLILGKKKKTSQKKEKPAGQAKHNALPP